MGVAHDEVPVRKTHHPALAALDDGVCCQHSRALVGDVMIDDLELSGFELTDCTLWTVGCLIVGAVFFLGLPWNVLLLAAPCLVVGLIGALS
jgi:hypothetical protein